MNGLVEPTRTSRSVLTYLSQFFPSDVFLLARVFMANKVPDVLCFTK